MIPLKRRYNASTANTNPGKRNTTGCSDLKPKEISTGARNISGRQMPSLTKPFFSISLSVLDWFMNS
jgi:hypothetical protein